MYIVIIIIKKKKEKRKYYHMCSLIDPCKLIDVYSWIDLNFQFNSGFCNWTLNPTFIYDYLKKKVLF